MTRLNMLLLLVAVLCALGVVTSQHRARVLFVELEREQHAARSLDEEWRQLQAEQSTHSRLAHIESVATSHLHMVVPPTSRVEIVSASRIPEATR
ncbi:MAG: cell division protein FtsL [Betaproteobacteria bacterium]|nr:cell division protein FtsL [Betaproteobacteria bacterium]